MAKPYSVTPILRAGSKSYSASFRNAIGKRVTRGLGTEDRGYAIAVCGKLCELWLSDVRNIASAPAGTEDHVLKLYFGEKDGLNKETPARGDQVETLLDMVRAEAESLPPALREAAFPLLMELARVRRDNAQQRGQIGRLKDELQRERTERLNLERSAIGRSVLAAARVPPIEKAFEQFETHIRAETSRCNAEAVLSTVKNFKASLPPERRTLADVTIDDISGWLDRETGTASEHSRATRRDGVRRRLGRFINWSANRWEYRSQMLSISAVEKSELDRERGEIHWHSLEEIEAGLKMLPDDYWRSLVSLLAFAGLQLAELVWLRTSDVTISKNGQRGSVWVTTVDDPDAPGARHLLKTGHRRREVQMHPRRLLPLIREHIKSGRAGDVWLFPALRTYAPRGKAKTKRWSVGYLGHCLRGQAGYETRKPQAALLPAGMNAKSLRRTFGSLLLRSRKPDGSRYSTGEVAAVMGNTEDVVRTHYARIIGSEVSVDF